MPALSPLFASSVETSTTSATFVPAATTAALANGTPYLVLVTANTIGNATGTPCESEVSFGGTRYGMTRYQTGAPGAPDSASGGQFATAFVATGDGVATVETRHRRISGGGTVTTTSHVGCIPLDSLTEGQHYWRAEETNGDTLTNPAAAAGWVSSGQSVEVTPGEAGNFLIIAAAEAEFTSGHTIADHARIRCRVIEDPNGTPSARNLQGNAANGVEGPEIAIDGGAGWGEYASGQRFLDVVQLDAGTTYRFELEYEGVAGNVGYRRARIFVLDLSVWPEFAFSRDITGQNGQDQTFATASATAPSAALDYVLLGAVTYQNNNSWIRTHFDEDPAGTPTRLPASAGFGMALVDNGNQPTDDYGLLSLQWERQGVADAREYAINCEADLQNCRWGTQRGVFPAADQGVATVLVAWGMETQVAAPPNSIEGSSQGGATVSGTLTASAALAGLSSGSSTATITNGDGASLDAAIAFVGNSFTENYGPVSGQGGLPTALQHLLDQREPTNTTSLGPPPYLPGVGEEPGSIAAQASGWFPSMTLGGMALYPTIDQRITGTAGENGTLDALDAVNSVADDAYDWVVLTSGLRQESAPGDANVTDDSAVARVVLPGSGGTGPLYEVCLEVTRRAVLQLAADGSTARVALRMTQEGFLSAFNADLSAAERIIRLQCLGARQLLAEQVVDRVVPDHYVWSRLMWGAFGPVGSGLTAPVAAYAGLTHSGSAQAGSANRSWLQRSQGITAPFALNVHQNAIATIVNAWIWGYAMFGVDPRGDESFSDPATMPEPLRNFVSPDGTRIYGGHNITGVGANGHFPYDAALNPGGPPDPELDLEWNATVRGQIQDIIVAAIDDWEAGTTEFDPRVLAGASSGLATVAGTMQATASASGSSGGTSSATATPDGITVVDLEGAAYGSSSGSAAVLTDSAIFAGAVVTASTGRPLGSGAPAQENRPWRLNPSDEGVALVERVVYPAITDRRGRVLDAELPADISGVTTVGLEVWDRTAGEWIAVAGTGSTDTEDGPDSQGRTQTWHVLRFAPSVGALQVVADRLGAGHAIPRRWVLGLALGGDQRVPTSGVDVLVLNPEP